MEILNILSLQNHIYSSTFKRSESILDLVIDRYTDPIVKNTRVDSGSSFSDHSLVLFDVILRGPQKSLVKEPFSFQNFKIKDNKDLFYEGVKHS